MTYRISACVITMADQTDPLKGSVLLGIKLTDQERVHWGARVMVKKDDAEPNHLRTERAIERALAGLVKLLALNPPPPAIAKAIQEACWSEDSFDVSDHGWADLTKPLSS